MIVLLDNLKFAVGDDETFVVIANLLTKDVVLGTIGSIVGLNDILDGSLALYLIKIREEARCHIV